MNRYIQVEGSVWTLKNDYEFQRFLLLRKTKVKLHKTKKKQGLFKYAKNPDRIPKLEDSVWIFFTI